MALSFQDKIKPVATSTTPLSFADKIKPVELPQPVQVSGATFKARVGENPLVAGAKAVGNLPSSAFNLGKGLVGAIRNPKETVKSIVSIPIGAGAALTRKALGDTTTPTSGPEEQFNALAQVMKERYGSLEALQRTATEDPFAFGADILGVLEGGASLVGKTSQLNRAIGTVGKATLSPASKAATGIADTSKGMARFATSQATGLNPETITELVKNPQAFKNINPELRVQTATQVADVLDQRLGELSDMGKGYEAIRQSEGIVTIPPDTIKNVLNKYGVKLDEGNKIITSAESRPLSAGDRAALQDFIDNYGSVTTHTNNSFLNTREALSNLGRYDTTKTNFSNNIARELRSEYDKYGKAQVKGLKDLDTAYAPERELLGQLKKDIIDSKTGDLKDGAISKIANITGKGKERVLERVKQIVPDIEERVRVLKAVEDIERAGGFKVGTYARAGLGVTGIVTGNVPAIIGAILAQPEIAVPLLKGAGYVGQKAAPILEALKNIANDINNFRLPAQFKNAEGQMKLGMSVEDVTKNIHPDDIKLSQEVIDALRSKEGFQALSDSQYNQFEKLAERWGISMDSTPGKISNSLEDIISGAKKAKPTNLTGRPFTTETKIPNSLAQEARKYKTAEEFVKSQGKEVYHSTDSEAFNIFDPTKAAKGETYFNPLGDGLFLSKDKDFTRRFGKNTFEYVLPKNAKTKVITDTKFQVSEYPAAVKGTLKKLGIKYDDLDLNDKVMINRLVENNPPIQALNEVEFLIKEDIAPKFGIKPKPNQVKDIMQGIMTERNSAYDAVIYRSTDDLYGTADEIIIPKEKVPNLKTKSQLTDIWNKANKKP